MFEEIKKKRRRRVKKINQECYINWHHFSHHFVSFFVAEKSDGVRCLALLTVNHRREPEVYLVSHF